MSKWIEKKTPPVLPIYFAALVWLVGGIVLPLYRLWALALTALLSAAAYVVGGRLCPKRVQRIEQPFMTGSEDADAMLTSVQGHLASLHRLNEQIPDDGLSEAIRRMETAGKSILDEVEQHPEKARDIRRFANYYLPDAVKILTTYAKWSSRGSRGKTPMPCAPRWKRTPPPLPRHLRTSWTPCTVPRCWTLGPTWMC